MRNLVKMRIQFASMIVVLLAGCCGGLKGPERASAAAVVYHNARYDLRFSLPASWRGHGVLVQEWKGQSYFVAVDKSVVIERGPVIVLRHPQWRAEERYQDIPILVFTHGQWEARRKGGFCVGVGGVEYEVGRTDRYVFAISSRFNADDSVKGWSEAGEILERNCGNNRE